jgi:hypothetical protein
MYFDRANFKVVDFLVDFGITSRECVIRYWIVE